MTIGDARYRQRRYNILSGDTRQLAIVVSIASEGKPDAMVGSEMVTSVALIAVDLGTGGIGEDAERGRTTRVLLHFSSC